MLSLSFITGTEPDKWFRRFTDRTDHGGLRTVASDDALAQLLSGDVDVALVRLPDARVTDEMHVVRLYDEQPGIALPVDHTLTLLEQVGETDIVGELIHYQGSSDIPAIREHLGVVAAGVGVVIAPRPVLKLLSGKKIVHREYRNPTYPATTIALVWRKTDDSEAIQDFVGIAKGRTPQSTRGSQLANAKPAGQPARKSVKTTTKNRAKKPAGRKPSRRRGGPRRARAWAGTHSGGAASRSDYLSRSVFAMANTSRRLSNSASVSFSPSTNPRSITVCRMVFPSFNAVLATLAAFS